jgi:hypothetical protein
VEHRNFARSPCLVRNPELRAQRRLLKRQLKMAVPLQSPVDAFLRRPGGGHCTAKVHRWYGHLIVTCEHSIICFRTRERSPAPPTGCARMLRRLRCVPSGAVIDCLQHRLSCLRHAVKQTVFDELFDFGDLSCTAPDHPDAHPNARRCHAIAWIMSSAARPDLSKVNRY